MSLKRHRLAHRRAPAAAGVALSVGAAAATLAALLAAACATPPPASAPAQQSAVSAEGTAGVSGAVSNGAVAPGAAAPGTLLPNAAPADPAAAQQAAFARWLAAFRAQALAAGITEATLKQALDGARYLPRVVELDRAQPEFTRAIWDYLDTAASPQRVARGQDKWLDVRNQAEAAEARYGVPGPVVVAIWGLESNYGGNYGSTPAIDALATLGFEGRREAWAKRELIDALKIIQGGDIPRERMLGSWAGAMGQTQFLPSNFLAYAVDADGDGRRDIWGSMADVVASTANFLARSGWQAGQPWGVEVQLPPGFDPARADDALRQGSSRWADEGLSLAGGGPLPAMSDAAVLLPAGARGPAFLVGPNFRAILRYNNSTSYALAVGLLAQQITGGPGVQASWPRELPPLSRSQLVSLQEALNQRGFNSGAVDGRMGPATRQALRGFQRSLGLPADGYPTLELLQSLQTP